MIKEHTPYNINDAVYSIKAKVAAKPLQLEQKTNIPSFNSLLKDSYASFKASIVCLKLKLYNLSEPKDKLLVYRTLSSEVTKTLAEDKDCFDSFAFGDYVFGVFYTPMKESMTRLIDCMAKINSTIMLFKNISGITDFEYVISALYGDVYFINNTESNGKVDYNWCGDIFEKTKQVAEYYSTEIVRISDFIYGNIPVNYQKFFSLVVPGDHIYGANVVNTQFNNWKDDSVISNK